MISIKDVKYVRPELSDEECLAVLQCVKNEHHISKGITRKALAMTADRLFNTKKELFGIIENMDKIKFDIGLDSGQAGIFDCVHYKNKNKKWYDRCCNITASSKQAGIIPFGTVCTAYLGEGYFSCNVLLNQAKEIVEISIDFTQKDSMYCCV